VRNRIFSIIIIVLILGTPAGWSQEKKLTIIVLEGEGAFNDIRRKLGRNPVIEVHDEEGKAVPGADVVFTLPEEGASGTFTPGGRTFLAKTDAQGRASTLGLRPNSIEGRYNIRLTASAAGKTGSLAISQSNTLAGGAVVAQTGLSRTKKILLVLAAGAAGGGIAVAVHGTGGGTVPIATTTLSPGPVTVGGPR
jgi:hypothetical protein